MKVFVDLVSYLLVYVPWLKTLSQFCTETGKLTVHLADVVVQRFVKRRRIRHYVPVPCNTLG